MASSTFTIHVSLDTSKVLLASNSEELKSPKLTNSPREIKKSPRYSDLTQLMERASPPREEEFKDVKKHEELTRRNSDAISRRKSSGNFSSFKVVKIESPRAPRKTEETKADEIVNVSPRK